VSNTSGYPEQGLTCFSSAVSQIPGYNWRESGCYEHGFFMSMWWDYVSELRPPRPIVLSPDNIWVWSLVDWYWKRKACPSATCPPQIPHGLTRARTRSSGCERSATKRLSHGTAYERGNEHWNSIKDVDVLNSWATITCKNGLTPWGYLIIQLFTLTRLRNLLESCRWHPDFFFRNVVCLLAIYCCIYKALLYVLFY
jgi:hypothetical protein